MTEDHIQIHKLYCSLTNRDMPMDMSMHWQWNAWKAKGWTEDDLRLVVQHINSLIRAGRRYPESFRFGNLIGNTSRFLEDLVEARALSRIPKVDHDRASVLRATGRPGYPATPDAKPVGEILSRLEIAKRMKELRLSL